MKNITEYIKESYQKEPNYINIKDLDDNGRYILCWFDEDNQLFPYDVKFMKHGNDYIFVNPDDDRDLMEYTEFLHKEDNKCPSVAVFDNVKDAEKFCNTYNKSKYNYF